MELDVSSHGQSNAEARGQGATRKPVVARQNAVSTNDHVPDRASVSFHPTWPVHDEGPNFAHTW